MELVLIIEKCKKHPGYDGMMPPQYGYNRGCTICYMLWWNNRDKLGWRDQTINPKKGF